jgi:uncharacterized protein (TIGR00369 family)
MTEDRRRTITWAPPTPPAPTLTGLEAVQAAANGTLPLPPFAALIGLATAHVEPGLVRGTLTPAEYHYNPLGTVHGGITATMLETVLAMAARTAVPAGRTCLTLEIKVNYVRPITAATGSVTAEGRLVQAGRQIALAEGRVTDAAGRLLATATSTCLVTDSPPPNPNPAEAERQRIITWPDPAPVMQARRALSGLDALRGPGFAPPIMPLLGMQMIAADPGRVQMNLPPAEHLYSQFSAVHGGMTAVLLDSAMGCAVQTTLPVGQAFTTLELKISFLRAMTAASGLLHATGQVQHAGRRIAAAEGRVVDAQDRLCATSTTTCLVFPV